MGGRLAGSGVPGGNELGPTPPLPGQLGTMRELGRRPRHRRIESLPIRPVLLLVYTSAHDHGWLLRYPPGERTKDDLNRRFGRRNSSCEAPL